MAVDINTHLGLRAAFKNACPYQLRLQGEKKVSVTVLSYCRQRLKDGAIIF